MNSGTHYRPFLATRRLLLRAICLLGLWALPSGQALGERTVNVPFLSGGVDPARCAIFWFGRVDNTHNHVNVRVGYNAQELVFYVHVFDRYLWYDTTPAASDLTRWDAVTVYLNRDGNSGTVPGDRAYQFVAQLNWWEERPSFQASYRGDGSNWTPFAIAFTTATAWRGNTLNQGTEARGWSASIRIPFAGLGFAGPPGSGAVRGLGVTVHDRDDAAGSPISEKRWPEALEDTRPDSWGRLHFGMPDFDPPVVSSTENHVLRQGLNGVVVPDAHVGGHSTCGEEHGPWYFPTWGSANYSGFDQVNIQNQWDVADWPCFSRYYVTFPIDTLPTGGSVVEAILRLHAFGNASGSPPPGDSLIQVFTTDEAWQENLITWNNAPLAEENVGSTWVSTVPSATPWPGVAVAWDVSGAVSEAYALRSPVRLVLYESDTQYHSGKYFTSSDTGEWNAIGRPTLEVVLGDVPSEVRPEPPRNLRVTVSP